jgi:hypothetical protein
VTARLLGPADEPRDSGAVVAVNFGDHREQEVWVRVGGVHAGTWHPLGGEYGKPQVAEDPRSHASRVLSREYWQRPPGTIPQHPEWHDVIARGPVVLLLPAGEGAYVNGWRAGRRDLWQAMEEIAEEDPREVDA